MTRRRIDRYILALTAAWTVTVAAACGSSPGPLGMETLGGKPALGAAYSFVDQGQPADGEVELADSASGDVTITGISAVAVPGEPAGRLVHVALASTGAGVAAARGWPPPVPIRPAIGAKVGAGVTRLIFGYTGFRAGQDYAMAGLRISYRYHGQSYTTIAWAVEVACVVRNFRTDGSLAGCQAATDKANSIVEKLAGLSS